MMQAIQHCLQRHLSRQAVGNRWWSQAIQLCFWRHLSRQAVGNRWWFQAHNLVHHPRCHRYKAKTDHRRRSIVSLGSPVPLFSSNHPVGMTYSSFPLLMTCPQNVDCLFLMQVSLILSTAFASNNFLLRSHLCFLGSSVITFFYFLASPMTTISFYFLVSSLTTILSVFKCILWQLLLCVS